jgi:4-alpha-glucanotransferase
MKPRRSGILLHISSLPSPFGIGDFGGCAYRFADFLADAGQSIWQVLPLTPTSSVCGDSPYSSPSAFAGNPLFISPDLLVETGYLAQSDIEGPHELKDDNVDYETVYGYKQELLRRAFARFGKRRREEPDFERFCADHRTWLDDYGLFLALKEENGGATWNEWPEDQRDRVEPCIEEWKQKLAPRIRMEKFFQFLFFRQWLALRKYCNGKNIRIIGDMPIYVSYDSADVWVNSRIFKLDDEKRPICVAGVPPDYFSDTGQLWGNPVYDWEVLADTRYDWWVKRFEHNLCLFDMVRLDHFRGFAGFWEVPASEETAVNGKWVEAPAWDFFSSLLKHFPYLPIIAEDLGIITADVREIIAHFGFPGMKVLLFAFGEDLATNPYAPHNHVRDCVVYTGTHDNNTIRGWFGKELSESGKQRLGLYIGRDIDENRIHRELIRLAMMSVSHTTVFPMQDILGLGEEARMNTPSTPRGNWRWRLALRHLSPELAEELARITQLYGRA